MRLENHQRVDGYAPGFVKPDPKRDLAAYDQLPGPLRRALDDCPASVCAVAALAYYKKHGVMAALREIGETADLFYALYEKETGVPRPVKPLGSGRKRCRR